MIGLILLIALATPMPAYSPKPPCPQSVGASNSILNFILPDVGACPPTLWAKTFEGVGGASVHPTSDGGFIVVGSKKPSTNFPPDIYVLRLNADGGVIWQKTYGGNNPMFSPAGNSGESVDLTSDGGFIVAGQANYFGAGYADFWVLRLDANGNVLWQRTYGGVRSDGYWPQVRTTSNGNFVLVGRTDSFGSGGDLWVLLLDPNGGIIWQKTYGGSAYDGSYPSVGLVSDGGFIVASATNVTNYFGAGNVDAWVLRIDALGNVMWQKTYGGLAQDSPWIENSVQQTSDGGFVVTGYTSSFGAGGQDFWVLRLDGNGTVLWQKAYGGTQDDVAYSADLTSDGGFIVSGYTKSFGAGGQDRWLLRLDYNGNLVWQKTYGGNRDEGSHSIRVTSDGGFISIGFQESFGGGGLWVLRLDANGGLPPTCSLGTSSNAVTTTSTPVINDPSQSFIASNSAATVTFTTIAGVGTSVKITKQC